MYGVKILLNTTGKTHHTIWLCVIALTPIISHGEKHPIALHSERVCKAQICIVSRLTVLLARRHGLPHSTNIFLQVGRAVWGCEEKTGWLVEAQKATKRMPHHRAIQSCGRCILKE